MGKRIVVALCLLCALVFAASGCATGVPLQAADGTTYEVTSCVVAGEYAGRVPSEGTEFLLITIQGMDSQLDSMEALFYGSGQKAQVTDGATTAECTLIVYAPRSSDKLDVVLLFQVPTSFAADFSLYGDGFDSVALSIDKD